MPAHTHTPRPPRSHFVPVLATAFALRLAVVLLRLRHDPRVWFFPQATELGRLADSLLSGRGLASPFGGATGPSAFLTPGYPAFVATSFRIFGTHTPAAAVALLFAQVVFSTLTVLAVMLAARKAFSPLTANVAGLLCALSPPLIFLPTLFWETPLSTLLLGGFLALAIAWQNDATVPQWIAAGTWIALALLINPSLALALLSILAWMIYRNRRASVLGPVLAIFVCIAIFIPWPIRNARALHAFIPARSNPGYELWQGNRLGSDGGFTPALHPNVNHEEFARYATIGEVAYMREKSALASAAIHADPARFLHLTAVRTFKFWAGLGSQQSSALVVGYILLTSTLGLSGIYLLARRNGLLAILFAAPMLLFPLPYYVTHPDFRFRLVLDPVLVVLSAYAITHWLSRDQRADTPAQSQNNPY